MDRSKVAAGIAAKYKELIPYLGYNMHLAESEDNLRESIDFGYSFLEKFIQLSLKIPLPSSDNINTFLNTINKSSTKGTQPAEPIFRIDEGPDSIALKETVLLAAPLFDYNPRRIKQFINAFRLKAHIANATGLFDSHNGSEFDALTLPRLGKFVALTLRWPRLIDILTSNLDLFDELLKPDGNLGIAIEWRNNQEFMTFLKLVSSPDSTTLFDEEEYSMKKLDVQSLLRTSSRISSSKLNSYNPEMKSQ